MLLRRLPAAAAAFALLSACATDTPSSDAGGGATGSTAAFDTSWPAGATASAERFRTDLETLASDSYMGREAGTAGFTMAVDYVVDAYEEIGLKPAGTDGYLQTVPLRRKSVVPEASVLEVGGQTLTQFQDYIIGPSTYRQSYAVEGEVVFVGYGLEAPQFGLDDYAGVDVEGKIVAVLQGAPQGLPSEEAAHFQRGSTKSEAAIDHGARGMILLTPRGGPNAAQLEAAVQRPQEVVVHDDGLEDSLVAGALLTEAGTDALATAAGLDGAAAFTPEMGSQPLGTTVRIAGKSLWDDFSAPNVVGMVEGSDPALKDEYVVLTAHLDHIGKLRVIDPAPDQDVINNGAMDNASGISTLLEEARKFANDSERPRRSILFVALTAEEKGLLGSEYFAEQPTVPADKMVANVNLDMPILLHEFTDVIAFGAEHSSLKQVATAAGESMGVTLTPDPVPNLVLFVRSDHYNFVKAGVPSVFLFLGFENGGRESFENFMATHYHRPSDEPALPILYDQAARFAELNYRIAKTIANADERPSWNEGDFFGEYFAD